MSTRGRKPKPTAVKTLQGNPGKRALPRREPKPTTKVSRPRDLKGEARKFWTQHAAELERLGVMTGVDVPAFRLMAEAYALSLRALTELQADGSLTIESKDGLKKHPLLQVFRDQTTLFKGFATEFGLTPSSRTRLQMPDPDEGQLSLIDMLFASVEATNAAAIEEIEASRNE